MHTHSVPKLLDISKKQREEFSKKEIEERLTMMNTAFCGQFYIVDCFLKKIYVDSLHSDVLFGYSKKKLEKNGMNFFRKTIVDDESVWLNQVYKAAEKRFATLTKLQRKNFILSYDLTAILSNGKNVVFHHKIMPYQLCDNGNIWLALCHLEESTLDNMTGTAHFLDIKTRKKYVFENGEFILYSPPKLTPEDMYILRLMIKGFSDKQMAGLMSDISIHTFKKKKRRLIQKMQAKNASEAIHRAHLLGVF